MLISTAWSIIREFFNSSKVSFNQKLKIIFLIILIIAIQLIVAYIMVIMNEWSGDFYNSLQNLDKKSFLKCIKTYVLILTPFAIIIYVQYVLQSRMLLAWRRWLTKLYLDKWINCKAYYGLNLISNINDNPDQRISEDVKWFTSLTFELTLGLFGSIITIISFVIILWNLSGVFKITFFGTDLVIKGYLVWAAFIYSMLGTFITYKIGSKLADIDYLQEKKEANFRFALVRVRENAENISVYKGEKYEEKIFISRLTEIIANSLLYIKLNANLTVWNNLFSNFSNILPIIISFPRLFSKEIQFGQLMQIVNAFGRVNDALSFIVSSFKRISLYKASVNRLLEFNQNIANWEKILATNPISILTQAQEELSLIDLTLKTPDGKVLLNKLNLSFKTGESYLICGRNGLGKSTLIKAIAGLWIYGNGTIIFPQTKKIFFIPQKTYMPLGTLSKAISYPSIDYVDISQLEALLYEFKIEYLIPRLNDTENWATTLSVGEQQKIAFIRALLELPDILLLDESSSAITENEEAYIYELVRKKLPSTTIISVGHRSSLKIVHSQEINLS